MLAPRGHRCRQTSIMTTPPTEDKDRFTCAGMLTICEDLDYDFLVEDAMLCAQL